MRAQAQSAPVAARAGVSGAAAPPKPAYANYVLAMLLATYTSGWVDRGIMGVLGQAIKVDMKLADWQLGVLTGFTFSIFYSLLGFPLARLAEKTNRVNLITVCLLLWSGFTALCGMASSFIVLLLLRCGVGVGEAGCGPGCHALLTDYFEPKKRTFAFSIYALGVPIGGMLGAVLGGWLTQYVNWRFALIAVGLPGILLAALMKLTVKEPVRGRMEEVVAAVDAEPAPSLREVWKLLFSKPTFRSLAVALSLIGMSGGISGAFLGPYYVREFHLNYAELGLIIGLMSGAVSMCGTLIGGFLSQSLGKRDARWYLLVPAIAMALATPVLVLAYLQNDWRQMIGLYMIPSLLQTTYLAPAIAATHNMVTPKMRASAAATFYFFINIIGMAMGPVIGGLAIDLLSGHIFARSGLGGFAALCPGGVAAHGAAAAVKAACATAQAAGTRGVLLLTPAADPAGGLLLLPGLPHHREGLRLQLIERGDLSRPPGPRQFADHEGVLVFADQALQHVGKLVGADDQDQADAAVEGAAQFVVGDAAHLLQPGEHRRQRPGVPVEARNEAVCDGAGRVLDQAAAGDVGEALDAALLQVRQDALHIDAGGRHQRLGERLASLERGGRVPRQAGALHDPADQRIAVGMRPRRAEADQDVARFLVGEPGQHLVAFDGADAEPRQIVIPIGVHARHLRRFAADQGAARLTATFRDSGDDGGGRLHVELAGGEIVQEHQGLGALREKVVDAHGDKVDADRVVDAGLDGDLQLGADAVGRGDQQRIGIARGAQVEERPKAAQRRLRARPAGGPSQRLDPLDQRIARIDVDAGLGIGEAVGPVGHLGNALPRKYAGRATRPCRLGPARGYS